MRCMPFSKHWDKLNNDFFTTFRVERKDADRGRDWHLGEQVQIVLHSRTPHRRALGVAEIISKVPRDIHEITEYEAQKDGFKDLEEMLEWLDKTHGILKLLVKPLSKFTLRWVKRES